MSLQFCCCGFCQFLKSCSDSGTATPGITQFSATFGDVWENLGQSTTSGISLDTANVTVTENSVTVSRAPAPGNSQQTIIDYDLTVELPYTAGLSAPGLGNDCRCRPSTGNDFNLPTFTGTMLFNGVLRYACQDVPPGSGSGDTLTWVGNSAPTYDMLPDVQACTNATTLDPNQLTSTLANGLGTAPGFRAAGDCAGLIATSVDCEFNISVTRGGQSGCSSFTPGTPAKITLRIGWA